MNVAGGCLVVTFIESPNDQAALEFEREVFEESIRRKTDGIIFDVSGISSMDSFMSRNMVAIFRVGHILGKKTIVVGLKPDIVASLVDLEIDLSRIRAAVNINAAIALINPSIADTEPLEAKDTPSDEDAELEEEEKEDDDEDQARETEEDLSE